MSVAATGLERGGFTSQRRSSIFELHQTKVVESLESVTLLLVEMFVAESKPASSNSAQWLGLHPLPAIAVFSTKTSNYKQYIDVSFLVSFNILSISYL